MLRGRDGGGPYVRQCECMFLSDLDKVTLNIRIGEVRVYVDGAYP